MSVIRELVVALAYRLDESSKKKVDASIAQTKGEATKLAAEIEKPKGPAPEGEKKFKSLGDVIGHVQRAIGALGAVAAVEGLASQISSVVQEFSELTSRLARTAPALGLSVQGLQGWEHAAKASGASAEQFAGAAQHLFSQFQALQLGSTHAAIALSGIRFKEGGEFRDFGSILEDVADKIGKIQDPIAQTQKAVQIFGEGGAALVPLLRRGREGIRELREEVAAFGAQISDEDVNANANYRRELSRTDLVFRGLKNAIGGPLVAQLAYVNKQFNDWVKTQQRATVEKTRGAFAGTLQGANALVGVMKLLYRGATFVLKWADFFGVLLASIAATAVGMALFGGVGFSAGLAMAAGWALAAAKFLIVAVLVALGVLLVEDFVGYLRGADSLIGEVGENFQKFLKEWSKPAPGDGWLITQLKTIAEFWGENGLKKGVRDFVNEARDLFTQLAQWFEEKWAPIRKFFDKVGDVAVSVGRAVKYGSTSPERQRELEIERIVEEWNGRYISPLDPGVAAARSPATAGVPFGKGLFSPQFTIHQATDPVATAQAVRREVQALLGEAFVEVAD